MNYNNIRQRDRMETNFISNNTHITMETDPNFSGVVQGMPFPEADYDDDVIDGGIENQAYEVEPDYLEVMDEVSPLPNVFPRRQGFETPPLEYNQNALPYHQQPVRTETLEEISFRLKFAYGTPRTDWFEEVMRAASGASNEKADIPLHVFRNLRTYPMTMGEKLFLHGKLKSELYQNDSQDGRGYFDKSIERERRRLAVGSSMLKPSVGLLSFWDGKIAQIAATFGSNVASYFRFIRFLVYLNFGIGLLMFCFITLPQLVEDEGLDRMVHKGFFGDLTQTIFFYGAYSNSNIGHYERPLAYLLTWMCVNLLAIIILVLNMYYNYRQSKMLSEKDDPYSTLCFSSWDYSMTKPESTKLWASALATRIREIKREDQDHTRRTLPQKCWLWLIRILCKFASLILLGGSGYLIYYVANTSIDPGDSVPKVIGDLFEKYQLPVVVSGLKLIIPQVLIILLLFEKWHPRTEIKVQIIQTALFYGASLFAFLISVYAMTSECSPGNSGDNGNATNNILSNATDHCCWENTLGEQIFQITIVDFLIKIGVGLLFLGLRAIIVNKCKIKKLGYPEFNVAGGILDLVYTQTLIWLGLFVEPFSAWVGVPIFFLSFYIQFGLVKACCQTSRSVFRASRSGSFFRFILLAALMGCLVPLTYAILNLAPSSSCGPFRDRDRVYTALTDRINLAPDWLTEILAYVITPMVTIPVIILLILLAIYYRIKSTTHQLAAKDLQNHLQYERRVQKRRVLAKAKLQRGISNMAS